MRSVGGLQIFAPVKIWENYFDDFLQKYAVS